MSRSFAGSVSRAVAGSIAMALVAMLGSSFAWSATMALVIDTQGTSSQRSKARVELLSELAPGSELQLDAAARVVLVHTVTGVEYTLHGPGDFRWTNEGAQSLRGGGRITTREPLGGTLRGVSLRTGRLAQASIAMRGEGQPEPLRLTSPVATWLLEMPREFSWQPGPGALSYRFELTDSRGTLIHVVESLTETRLTLPPALGLEPGRTYAWQVTAHLPTGARLEGWTEFGVAGDSMRASASRAQPPADAGFSDRLLYAALLDTWGLREQADGEWRRLASDRPDEQRIRARAAAQ